MSFSLLKSVAKGAIALIASIALPATATSPNYDSLFVFGDSLSDTGNDFALSSSIPGLPTIPPQPFYFEGRFTNNLNWVDYFSQGLGLNPVSFNTLSPGSSIPRDGLNFAAGGATTGSQNEGNPPYSFPGLEQQIDAFDGLLGGRSADPDALYVVWAGANDYFGRFASDPLQPINNLSNAIADLANAGARDLVVFNLPDLGKTPLASSRGPVISQQLSALSEAHNALLAQNLNGLSQAFPQTNITSFDVNALYRNVETNPAAFGFKNITDNCTGIELPNVSEASIPGFLSCSAALTNDPKAFLFYDNQHPTSAAHQIIANALSDRLSVSTSVPEPATIPALGLLGLFLFGRAIRKA
jgi:phospholipase/lecithinase/hemolysin